MEDKLAHTWLKHYFVLTANKLIYSGGQEIEDEQEDDTKESEEVSHSVRSTNIEVSTS